MKLQIEIPDDWYEKGRKWDSTQLMSCNQCSFKTPSAALYATHVFTVHTRVEDEATLTTAP